MNMEYIFEQGSGIHNEDYLITHEQTFGVFDGATSLNSACLDNGKSGGARASTIAGQTFLGASQTLVRLGIMANTAIRSEMEQCGVDFSRRCGLWSTSAAVVRLKGDAIEWFQTGDSQVVFIGKDGDYKVAAKRLDHDFPSLSLIKEKGRDHPDVHQLVKRVREDMNRSYGVLNGEREAVGFFRMGEEKVCNIKTVLLFTDGLDIPCPVPQRYKDFSCLVRMSQELGLQGLRDYVRDQEQSDQDLRAFPRFKQHDDIAAVALHL